MDLLTCVLQAAPFFAQICREEDIALAIADREKLIFYSPDKSNPLDAKPGSPITKGQGMEIAMTNRRMTIKSIPKEVFGVPSRTVAIPIIDERNEVVGAIAFGVSLVRQSKLSDLAELLVGAIARISSSMSGLIDASAQLGEAQSMTSASAEETRREVDETAKVTEIVKRIASQTNILGFNASIEAARAGEHGRAFQVVASEVRKLANDSVQAVNQAEERFGRMKEAVEAILNQTNAVDLSVRRQALEFEEIESSLRSLNELSQRLLEASRNF